ncbi:hypothetical protein FMN50_19605 [Rhodobacterales bacterium]|nr:hypothetical protein FMN50_19605 [Rhodobacterales bacterium]
MLQAVADIKAKLLRTDPGALRLVRGIHLMLTILAAVFLANVLAAFAPGQSAFKLAVLAGAAGGHTLLFTPVSTRKAEIRSILGLGAIVTGLFSAGTIVAEISGKDAPQVLQILWVGLITVGFALQGINPFWQRGGRMLAICWLFVVLIAMDASPGLWLPVMGALGASTALCIRIGFWRPSTYRTYRRVEAANRQAMADHLLRAASRGTSRAGRADVKVADLAKLRIELQSCADLMEAEGPLHGLSPEAATMVELALEVVRDAHGQLSQEARTGLTADAGYISATQHLAARLRAGQDPDGKTASDEQPDTGWVTTASAEALEADRFQLLRIAQAFRRLWILAGQDNTVSFARGQGASAARKSVWHRITWRLAAQAGISATVGYALGRALDLNHAYWVTLTIIIVLSNSLGATLVKTAQRIAGTAIGVVAAMVIDPALAEFHGVRLVLVVLAIPAAIVFTDRNYAIASAIISFLVVVGLQTLEGLPIDELWSRIYDTVIGAGVGLAAAWLLFPNRTSATIAGLTADYLQACRDCLRAEETGQTKDLEDLARLRSSASQLIAKARDFRVERAPWSSFTQSSGNFNVLVIVLAQYVVLYREARSGVLQEAAVGDAGAGVRQMIERMNRRLEDEFAAVLDGRGKQTVQGLGKEWLAAVPKDQTSNLTLMTDWVAMLYHARKILRCLEGLRDVGIPALSNAGRNQASS